jgi:hypothetical protein
MASQQLDISDDPLHESLLASAEPQMQNVADDEAEHQSAPLEASISTVHDIDSDWMSMDLALITLLERWWSRAHRRRPPDLV